MTQAETLCNETPSNRAWSQMATKQEMKFASDEFCSIKIKPDDEKYDHLCDFANEFSSDMYANVSTMIRLMKCGIVDGWKR